MKKIIMISALAFCCHAMLASSSQDNKAVVTSSNNKEERPIVFDGLFNMVRTNQMHSFYTIFNTTGHKTRHQIALHVDKQGYSLIHLGVEIGDGDLIS